VRNSVALSRSGGGGEGYSRKRRGRLRGPGDGGGRGVPVGHAEQRGVRAAHVPVVVVALDGHGGRVCRRETSSHNLVKIAAPPT